MLLVLKKFRECPYTKKYSAYDQTLLSAKCNHTKNIMLLVLKNSENAIVHALVWSDDSALGPEKIYSESSLLHMW